MGKFKEQTEVMKDVIAQLRTHQKLLKFKQNIDFGERADAHMYRIQQMRALHWWLHEIEMNNEGCFFEVEIALLELALMQGKLDEIIYS